MRMLTLTAALMVGTAAIAQTAPEPPATPPADTMQAPPAPEATPPAAPAAPAPMAEPAPAAAAPAAAPAPAEAAAPVAQASYPRCSKTVTDQCRQSSARESDTKGGRPKHSR